MNKRQTFKKIVMFFLTLIIMCGVVPGVDFGVKEVKAATTLTVSPLDDVYTYSDIPIGTAENSYYDGQDNMIYVGCNSDYGFTYQRSALKFDISSIPYMGTIKSATLKLNFKSHNAGAKINLVSSLDDTWSESATPNPTFPTYNTENIINGYKNVEITSDGEQNFDVTSYIINKLADGKATVVLTGVEGNGLSEVGIYSKDNVSSNPVLVITYNSTEAPTGLNATAGNGSVNLSWNASTGATSYKIYKGTSSTNVTEEVATGVKGTNYTVTGLTNGSTYYFAVKAVNSDGESGNSNVASATPVAPVSVTVTAGKGLGRPDKKPAYSNVKIPFVIDSESFGKNLNAYSFDVIYDPTKVGTVTVDSFNGLAKPTIGTPTAEGSKEKVTVNWSGTFSGDLTSLYNNSNGVLFKLNFIVKPAFTSGETAVEVGSGSFTFAKGGATTDIKQNNGKILFGIYGDINCDGAITSTDTGLINKYTSGKTAAISGEVKETAADVNEDGVINSADGTEISNYISGKTSTLKTLFGY